MIATALLAAAAGAMSAQAAVVQTFSPPAQCPTCTSGNYTGQSNGSLPIQTVIPGSAYDRFIVIWLENTDFATSAQSQTFQNLAAEGILLTNYNGVTHPSEPNYVAGVAGDFFGIADDNYYALPSNVSTVVDLLDTKNISWASYQENMPYDGYAHDYAQPNYLNKSAGMYTYYKRKHNGLEICNSVSSVKSRQERIRNFNDFAVDVNATALPQYVIIVPNLVNDIHDTDVTFGSAWLEYWLVPLLKNPSFNDNRTLILLTYDENENYNTQNTVYTVLLGGAVPSELKGTTDSNFYTHYSQLSSIQNNWGLPSLGRQDANQTVAQVFDFQANKTGYKNIGVDNSTMPMMNYTGIFAGPCNNNSWTPVLAPNVNAQGAGNNGVWYSKNLTNTSMTSFTPWNLTAMGIINPTVIDTVTASVLGAANSTTSSNSSSSSGSPSSSASAGASSSSTKSGAAATVVLGSSIFGLTAVAMSLVL